MPQLQCRPMTESDLDAAVEIYIGYYNAFEGGAWTPETARRRIRAVLRHPESMCLMLMLRGEAVGFAMGCFEQYDDLVAYDLVEIVLVKACQNQGLGTRFMQLIEAQARQRGAGLMQLQSVNDEMHAHFYDKLGFATCTNLVLKSKLL